MQKRFLDARFLAGAAAIALATFASAPADAGGGRQSMEQCTGRVLGRLLKARAPETQVGPAVIQQCDAQLRSTLAAAIRSGEAGGCTVESCLTLAQQRAAEEATQAYRAQMR